jgi:ABC-type uncharacterized transport system substrate-binding protein
VITEVLERAAQKPAELPIERPMKFELVINLKAAKTLRLVMPRLADDVIQ